MRYANNAKWTMDSELWIDILWYFNGYFYVQVIKLAVIVVKCCYYNFII